MSKLASLILALPILPGKVEAWRRLCQELSEGRRGQRQALRERLGVVAIRGRLLQTPRSSLALLLMEAEDADQVLVRLAGADDPFSRWLRRELREIHALNLESSDEEPNIEPVFTWEAV